MRLTRTETIYDSATISSRSSVGSGWASFSLGPKADRRPRVKAEPNVHNELRFWEFDRAFLGKVD